MIIDIYNLFARFVPKSVLEEYNHITDNSKMLDYDARLAESLNNTITKSAIDDIGTYICSISEKYIFDKLRNASGVVLFVEPGEVTLLNTTTEQQRISIMLVAPFNVNNNDSLNESILLDHLRDEITTIINKLQFWVATDKISCSAQMSVENVLTPIPLEAFEQHIGWQVFITLTTPRC